MIERIYRDDSDITEITIQPDGRIYAFGLSGEVSDILHMLEKGIAEKNAQTDQTTELQPLLAKEGASDDQH